MGGIKKWISLLLFLASGIMWGQQITVEGRVLNAQNEKVNSANVLAIDSLNQIQDYTYTGKNGKYLLELPQRNTYTFVFSSMGYVNDTIVKNFSNSPRHLRLDAQLKPSHHQLDEVFLKSKNPIKIRKDTVSFLTDHFTNGTEETVEDLLRKIPGLRIDEEGTIKIGNREVEKVMVENDDFFGHGYKILTKNMPAHPVEQVDILKHYSANELLKGIEDSDKVALNLKLKDDSKRIWFGIAEAGGGNHHFYKGKFSLMNFGKKNSYYFLGSLNNIGEDVTGDLSNLIYSHSSGEPGHVGDNEKAHNLIGLSAPTPDLGKNRSSFNKDKLVSLDAIFNPTKKLKVKPLLFFNGEDIDFHRRHTEKVAVGNTHFTNTKDYALHQKNRIAFGKLDIQYAIDKTQHLKAETRYNNGQKQGLSSLLFNGNATREKLDNPGEIIDQNIQYTNKFDKKKVFLLTGRFIDERSPEQYRINQFYYGALFPNLARADNVQQYSNNNMQFFGLDAHLLDRHKNGNLLEIEMGSSYRRDRLHSRFSVLKGDSLLENPAGYQNQTVYGVNDWYARRKYQLQFYNFSFTGIVAVHQLFNSLKNIGLHQKQHPFFVNPQLGIRWNMNKNSRLSVNYDLNTTNAGILEVYPHYILTGFRSFQKGTGSFDQLKASNFSLHYRLGNWSNRFFAHATILYLNQHDFFSTDARIQQDFTQIEKLLIKDRETISAEAEADYFLPEIHSNLKLKGGYAKSHYKNLVNGSNLRKIQSGQYHYGLALRSSFGGIFDYHIGTQWKIVQITTETENSYIDNQSFLDLYFQFNEQWDAVINSSLYHFGNLQSHKNYGFLDIETKYKIIKNRLTLKFTGKNLFDTRTFRRYSVSDISTSTTGYRLLPRMILLGVKFRF